MVSKAHVEVRVEGPDGVQPGNVYVVVYRNDWGDRAAERVSIQASLAVCQAKAYDYNRRAKAPLAWVRYVGPDIKAQTA